MSYRRMIVAWFACACLVSCSGGGGKKRPGSDAGEALGDGSAGGGAAVDLDNDGKPDGVAIDMDGDGKPDGVDTDNDGKIDQPLPDADSGVTYVPPDAGPLPFPVNENGQVLCGSAPCACSDGVDNDNDGLTDLEDPECVASWDNDEGSFATGIDGDNRDNACQDCFFDGNSGSGDDDCRLPTSCLETGPPTSGRGNCNMCEQSAACVNFCKAFTPNGCDCFGCCTVHLPNGTTVNVALGAGCNIDGNTVEGCNTCVPNDSCKNECGRCELCPGKTVKDLPADCFTTPGGDGGDGDGDDPGYTCDDGATRCGAGLSPCEDGYSCDFGCCVRIPILL